MVDNAGFGQISDGWEKAKQFDETFLGIVHKD